MGRPPCCDKANVKKGLWTPEEDAKILAYVSNHGVGNWTQVPKKAGLNRCGKSCRLRWTNYLRPDLKHEEFTEQEEQLIIQYHAAIGSRWSLIAKHLPGRTDNDVKNYWNTKLKKKLAKMGIDPVTHKPISKILSDYESISCLSNNHQIRSLDQNITNSFSSQSYSWGQKNSVDPLLVTDITEEEHSYQGFLAADSPPQIQEKSSQFQLIGANHSNSKVTDDKFGMPESKSAAKNTVTSSYYDYEPSSVNSFVKTLLDRDNEIQLDFPAFDDILDY
uniref:Uncharacterized protein n=1 Tax=Chenopodium quinoa TaxID=63459 RepID=A0A803LSY0_CHEQI